jgi:restriction system protein
MADITKRRTGELTRKVLEILTRYPDGLQAGKVIALVEAELGATPFEASMYPKNPHVRRFEKIVRFSTIALVKAGWMSKDRGLWTITDEGRKAFSAFREPEEFRTQAYRLYKEWEQAQPPSEDVDETADGEAEAAAEDTQTAAITLEEAEESAWNAIEAYLAKMNPFEFQKLVAGLLRGMQYHVSWSAPPGPDRGIDILAHRDPLGVEGGRIKVQVKRRADRIAVGEVRSFLAVLGDEDVGIFVATGGFTSDAEVEARSQERRRLMLLDARRLLDLWIEYYGRISEEARRLLPLRAVHFLAPLGE